MKKKTKNLSAEAIRLLKLAKSYVLKYPMQTDMDHWFYTPVNKEYRDAIGRCNTTACIAGWICTAGMVGKPMPLRAAQLLEPGYGEKGHDEIMFGQASFNATSLLGLASHQTMRLFHVNCWPVDLAAELRAVHSHAPARASKRQLRSLAKQYAAIVAKRIDLFIKSDARK